MAPTSEVGATFPVIFWVAFRQGEVDATPPQVDATLDATPSVDATLDATPPQVDATLDATLDATTSEVGATFPVIFCVAFRQGEIDATLDATPPRKKRPTLACPLPKSN